MFIQRTIQTICFLTVLCGLTASGATIQPLSTTQPNEFRFTSDVYYVQEGATNALIEVAFVPGSRSYSGSVDYRSANGTAVSGQDYYGVTNTLSFSGLAPSQTFMISVPMTAARKKNETVMLFLSNPSALITRSNATLVILANSTPQAKLDMVQANGAITVSWPSTFTNCVLQKATSFADANWSNVPQPTAVSNGRYSFTTAATGSAFFRLKQN
jgi:hypothetical protein